jgi:hypothetical protein
MTIDTRARATANRLIDQFGKQITITHIIKGEYNPSTGEMAADIVTSESTAALIKDYNGFELTNGVVQAGDLKIKIAALQITEPSIGDTVTIDSLVYSVLAIKHIWSGEMSAIYELQVRK